MTEPTLTAEIVTFRTLPGTPAHITRNAAEGIGPALVRCQGFLARTLSLGEDGTWTDHVLWERPDLAHRAAERIMAEPEGRAFMALIDPASVRMTHAPVMVAQKAA
ncbi:MAG: hypothetical protein ACKVPY_16835 [Paracoccaceae bacterium]